MVTREEVINILRAEMPYFAREYHVKQLGLFGSMAQNHQTSQSDVDIIVEFDQPIGLKFIELADYLEQLLHKRVDLLTLDSLETIRVPSVAASIKEKILYVPTS